MSGVSNVLKISKTAAYGAFVWVMTGAFPASATDFTAGVALEKMEPGERITYVSGIVEGMAYARFRKDTLAAGQKDETGSRCIREWFASKPDGKSMMAWIDANFVKFPDYTPATIVYAMVKKECGE